MTFASGKYAKGECDRCGFTVKYTELSSENIKGYPSGSLLCPECVDVDHPQRWVGNQSISDSQSLRDPRPVQNKDQQLPVGTPVDFTWYWGGR